MPKALVGLLLLSACATAPDVITRTEQVKVPITVRVYCDMPATPLPAFPIAKLTPDTRPAETVRAYAESIATLKTAVRERDTALAACATPPASSKQ